jgi:hypothetical protein
MGAALGSEEEGPEPAAATAPSSQPAPPAPPHPALLELERRGFAASEGKLAEGARGVALRALGPSTGGSGGSGGSGGGARDGILSPVDCCVLTLAMPPAPKPKLAPAQEREPDPEPEPEPAERQPPPEPAPPAAGPPSDPDEMRLWLQAQVAAASTTEPEPEPEPEALSEAVPPPSGGEPSIASSWEKLYDSHVAGTALHTFGRGVAGYDGPSLLVLRVRPKSTPVAAASAGVIGAYMDSPWRIGEKFFGGNRSYLFSMAERDPDTLEEGTEEEHCRIFPAASKDKAAPGNIGYLCTEPRRGGPERGVGFGGKSAAAGGSSRAGKSSCRLWIDADLCRGQISLDPRSCTTYAPGDLLWWSSASSGSAAGGLSREFEVLRIEAYGCSPDAEGSLRKRDEERRRKEAAAARARKVDVRNFVDGETGRLDSGTSALLSGGEYGVKDAADLTKQSLQAQR